MIKFLTFALLTLFTLVAFGQTKQWQYPPFVKGPEVDTFFGVKYPDPFRALEDTLKPQTKNWYEQQKVFYKKTMGNLTGREKMKADLEKYSISGKSQAGLPRATKNGIFFLSTTEGIQSIMFRNSQSNTDVKIFSTQSMGKMAKKYSIDYYEPSVDGRYIAFGLSIDGDELSTLRIVDVKSKTLLKDRIERAMYGNPQWLSDGSGFFYTQLKEQRTEEDKQTVFENSKTFLHYIGKPADKEIASYQASTQLKLELIDFPFIFINPTSQKAVLAVYHGSSSYQTLYVTELTSLLQNTSASIQWKKINSFEDKVTEFALFENSLFFIASNKNAYGTLNKADISNLTDKVSIQEVLVGKEEVITSLMLTKKNLYVKTLKNGVDLLTEFNPRTLANKPVPIPNYGGLIIKTMGGIYAHYVPSEGLYLFNCTWNKDWTIYYYNPENSTITQKDIYPLGPYSHAPQLIIKEVEVPLSDGTLVPLTIVYSNKIKLNADNPTILTGYGSYGYNYSPSFSQTLLAWYENGGIFAVAHVRGGGEKGDAWYQGGFKSTKPNSWKDFIACAEYLIKNNYTSPKKLAAEGSSAGGITVGMAIIERPELFKAAYISYGAVNQLRDEFTSNTLGVTEFGSIKDSIEVKYLYNMDVYQHINSQSNYPSVLFTTAMKDSRVAFWQPAKAAARMQSVSKGDNLVLLRISEEGHWGESDAIDEEADKYSFLFWQLGHPQFQNNAVPKNKPID